MGRILEGKPVAEEIYGDIARRAEKLKVSGVEPTMVIIRVGERPDDIWYEKSIIKNCEKVGLKTISDALSTEASEEMFLDRVKAANADKSIHAIMIMRPLPPHISEKAVQAAIDPQKDCDCISETNLAKIFTGGAKIFPCTAQAVVNVLKYYEIPLSGAKITVAGRSAVVGKPLALMLLNENATVTVCHSRTKNIDWHMRNANVAVAAIGKAKLFGKENFNEDSIVIDVGVNVDEATGKMCGDVDFDGVKDFVKAITPSSGGVGAVTTAVLINNAMNAAEGK